MDEPWMQVETERVSLLFLRLYSGNECFYSRSNAMTIPSTRTAPLQNKVDPRGDLHAVRARGTLMGNRGILHNEHDQIVRRWTTKSWVSCCLDASFQKRSPFTQGTYSELFFLDEATAYAAGHRPCRVCQRHKHDDFNRIWTAANRADHVVANGQACLPIAQIDAVLHAERVGPDKAKRTHAARLSDLPVGAMAVDDGRVLLIGPKGLRAWSFHGYSAVSALPVDTWVQVLTPPSIVAAIRQGMKVAVHPSATHPEPGAPASL